MKTLNNSQQIPQLVSDTARMEQRWPDSGVGYDRPLLMGKIDTICFQSGKSQLADPGHPWDQCCQGHTPTSSGDVSNHEGQHNGH